MYCHTRNRLLTKVFLCKNLANNNHVVMLQHPNIIAYYSSFVEEKSLMIAMEYAPGGTLYELIQERNGKLIEEEVRRRGRGRGEGGGEERENREEVLKKK